MPRGKEGTVVIREGTQAIYNSAFCCSKVSEVKFPTSLREIKRASFPECPNLVSVHLNDELEIIGAFAFSECKNLENVYFGKSLKSIRAYAFEKDTKLCNINFPKTLTIIGDAAFTGCPLENVVIPPSVHKIGKQAFASTLKLKAYCYNKALLMACIGPYYPASMHTMMLQIGEREEIVLPKHNMENDLVEIDKCIRKFLKSDNVSDLVEIYKYGGDTLIKILTAIKISETYNSTTSAKRYLRRMAEEIVKWARDENALIDMISDSWVSDTALKQMLNASQKKGYTIANAYILKKLNNKANLHV